jgi:internalin A
VTKLDEALARAADTGAFELADYPLTILPQELAQVPILHSIKLWNTGLEKLPEWLADIDNLTSFELSDSRVDCFPDGILQLRELRHLRLHGSKIGELPRDISRLSNLETLVLRGCGLRSLPESLSELTRLIILDLGSNMLGEVGDVAFPSRLEFLTLWGNGLTAVPESIRSLTNLRMLDLSANGSIISFLPGGVLLFRHGSNYATSSIFMQYLNEHFGGSATIQFPEQLLDEYRNFEGTGLLSHVSNFRDLRGPLGGDETTQYIDQVPERLLNEYHDLELLKLQDRVRFRAILSSVSDMRSAPGLLGGGETTQHIDKIPEWLFDECHELAWLDLSGNRISNIPSNVSNSRRLHGILLAGNRIEAVPDSLFDLESIVTIDLANNRLTTLPKAFQNIGRLSFLDLSGNPLQIPPEILAQPTKPSAIWEYLARIREDTRPLDEAKVLVVGEGSVGKTSLIRRLVQGDYDQDERKTEGIKVTRWQLPVDSNDIALNVWDFGGQEIMHATHQFFLTRRSVYLLVLDVRQSDEQNRIEYWLKLIHGFSGGSPVIIVGNKCENIPLDIDRRGLRAKHSNVVAILETSCLDDVGMAEVKQTLSDTIRGLAHVRDPLPRSFFEVKEHLEQLDANYLSFPDYEKLCREYGVNTQTSQELLVGFLHDLGTVLCFREDPRLRDTNILNPSWVTGGVYRLLNSITAAQLKGLLTWRHIDEILQSEDYPANTHGFIVEMMKKFELCYESDNTFLVPDLLTKEEPDTGSWDDALRFSVKYDVLPSSIMGRLIVRMRRLISKGTVWRTGVILEMDGNRALIKADREDALLSILVSGPARGRRGLLTAIRAELRAIERTIPGLTSEERVPVPDHDAWVPHSHLLRLEDAGKDTVVPLGLVQEYRISELLDGVETREDRAYISPHVPIENQPSPELQQTTEADAKAWNPRQSLALGGFLIVALLAVITAYVAANKLVGGAAAAAIGAAALLVVIVIAFFVLRIAGRVSEDTLLSGVKSIISRLDGSSQQSNQGDNT